MPDTDRTSETPTSPLRQLDLIALALALPVFLLAHLPMLGYAIAAGVWLLARGIELLLDRRVSDALARGDRRAAMGTLAASKLGRAWLVVLAVLLVGLANHKAGLSAAVLALVLFTIHLATQVLTSVRAPGAEAS